MKRISCTACRFIKKTSFNQFQENDKDGINFTLEESLQIITKKIKTDSMNSTKTSSFHIKFSVKIVELFNFS